MGLGGVAIAVSPYVIHPKTAVLGRAGGGGGHWAEAAANAVGHDYDLDVVVIMHYIVIFTFESP